MTTTALAVFPTKVDRWLAVVLSIGLVVQLVSFVSALTTPNSITTGTLALSCVGLFAPIVLLLALAVPTRYELHSDQLVIRSGLIRYRIPYAAVRGVEPTRNPLSAPAWSLDRLKIKRPSGFALISPKDKDGFMRALLERAPHLKRDGDRLVLVA
jgi:membrane protein YdbS with pleckstrin-like domain